MSPFNVGSGLVASAASTIPNVSVAHLLMQMVIAIAVIGGGIWLFGKIVQRRRAGLLNAPGKSALRGLSVLSRTSLGKDHHVAVVAWGQRQFLIGISGTAVCLLAESEHHDPDAAEEPAPTGLRVVPERTLSNTSNRSAGSRPTFVEALRTATLRG